MVKENYTVETFLNAAREWVCDSYSIDVRYIALKDGEEIRLIEGLIFLNPLLPTKDLSLRIETADLVVEQKQSVGLKKSELIRILEQAVEGKICSDGNCYALPNSAPLDFHSEMAYRNRWVSNLHLQIRGQQPPLQRVVDFGSIDNQLRQSEPPFDGLQDLVNWLGLTSSEVGHTPPLIRILVNPPVGIVFNEWKLQNDQLTVVFRAHPQFDLGKMNVAIRAVPGKELASRKQITRLIEWNQENPEYQEGLAHITVEHADNALVMLMIGNFTAQRQWIMDPEKARNSRLLATQAFDKDLKMIRRAIIEPDDQNRFEKGICALLFLLGFAPAVQVETDAPDLIVATPNGRIILIECTLRIADFSLKLGKLVDRCRAVSRTFDTSSHAVSVYGVLVCALPKDQIAARANELEAHKLCLITKEDLVLALERLRFSTDADQIFDELFHPMIEQN